MTTSSSRSCLRCAALAGSGPDPVPPFSIESFGFGVKVASRADAARGGR